MPAPLEMLFCHAKICLSGWDGLLKWELLWLTPPLESYALGGLAYPTLDELSAFIDIVFYYLIAIVMFFVFNI